MGRSKLLIVSMEKRNLFNYYGLLRDFDYDTVEYMWLKEDNKDMAYFTVGTLEYDELTIVVDSTTSDRITNTDFVKLLIQYSVMNPNINIYSLEFKKPILSTKYNQYRMLSHTPYLLCSV